MIFFHARFYFSSFSVCLSKVFVTWIYAFRCYPLLSLSFIVQSCSRLCNVAVLSLSCVPAFQTIWSRVPEYRNTLALLPRIPDYPGPASPNTGIPWLCFPESRTPGPASPRPGLPRVPRPRILAYCVTVRN